MPFLRMNNGEGLSMCEIICLSEKPGQSYRVMGFRRGECPDKEIYWILIPTNEKDNARRISTDYTLFDKLPA